MAKTFDNISEASATNYLFLFAQRTLALENEPPTPPPLSALGLPCNAICLLRDLLPKKETTLGPDGRASEAAATAYDFAGNIAPLAEKVTAYILNPLPWSVTLWVTEARRVLVTATSWSCALASKLRL